MKIVRPIVEALVGFVLWTAILTPYMVFIVRTSWAQYWAWFLMQLIIVPPVAVVVVRVTNAITRRLEL